MRSIVALNALWFAKGNMCERSNFFAGNFQFLVRKYFFFVRNFFSMWTFKFEDNFWKEKIAFMTNQVRPRGTWNMDGKSLTHTWQVHQCALRNNWVNYCVIQLKWNLTQPAENKTKNKQQENELKIFSTLYYE